MSPEESSQDEEELGRQVDRVFDRLKYCEVRITVRLPDSYPEPRVFTHTELMFADLVRIENVQDTMPPLLKRIVHSLITSMRFR